jgi:CRP-like cAMP-binding protein
VIDNIVKKLEDMTLMDGISTEVLRAMAENGKLLRLENGDVVFEEGAESDRNIYFMLSGTAAAVKFMRKNERDVGIMQGGDYFGEFALFTKQPRQAKVEAREKTEILEVSYAVLDSLKDDHALEIITLYENMFAQVAKRFSAMAKKAEKTQFWLK